MSAKNIPTPWRVSARNQIEVAAWPNEWIADCDSSSESPGPEVEAADRANAKLIVRAVNSHQALIDALDAMVDANPTPRTQEAQAAYEQAVAALKLARGES